MEESAGGGVKWWIKVLVLFHMFAITFWSLPDPPDRLKIWSDNPDSSLLAKARPPSGTQWVLVKNRQWFKRSNLHYYLTSTGFWQYWDMFAPNPSDTDLWGTATVTYKDGATKLYAYPRIYDLPIPRKYLMERYRKFFERASNDGFKYLWIPFAKRVALLNRQAGNPVVKVELTRHWMVLPGPGKPMPTDYQTYTYFTYEVPPSEQRD